MFHYYILQELNLFIVPEFELQRRSTGLHSATPLENYHFQFIRLAEARAKILTCMLHARVEHFTVISCKVSFGQFILVDPLQKPNLTRYHFS